MRRVALGWFLLCLVGLILEAGSPGAYGQGERVRVWVGFDRFSPEAVGLVRAAGGTIHYEFPSLNAVAATLPKAALEGLRRNPNVVEIEEDPIRVPYAETTPYGISMVQANMVSDSFAWKRKICIIDSGYYKGHVDLQDGSVTASLDSGTGDPFTDNCGHGTHVAGTVAALFNGEGVVGVMPSGQINIHIVKVFGDSCSWTYSSSLVNAANQCSQAGANVISMSLGGSVKSIFEQRAFDDLYKNGILPVAAAGNGGNTQKSYPASYNSVISVAAIDSNKVVASFSQKNDQVELAAPGVGVLSTVPWLETDTLTVGATTFTGNWIENAARGTASGNLANGGLCDSVGGWVGKVVLCQRGTISFFDKVMNVQAGGGTAAVIYNNVSGNFLGTLGAGNSSNIPAISLSQEDGVAALGTVNSAGTVVSSRVQPGSGYEAWDGTSMATPHVSGVAALVWSHNTTCTNDQIRQALDTSAMDLGATGRDTSYGYGLVQAFSALNALPAICGGGGGGQCKPKGDSCTTGSECCSGSCGGKPGSRTCK